MDAYGSGGSYGAWGCGKETTRKRGRRRSRVARNDERLSFDPSRRVGLRGVVPWHRRRCPPRASRGDRAPEPVVVVVGLVAPRPAHRPEPLRAEVLAEPHRLESVLRMDRSKVHLADQRRLVTGSPELVSDRPEPFAQRDPVLLRGESMRLETRQQRRPRWHADRRGAVGGVEDHAGGGERIEGRRLEVAVAPEPDLIVALLVGHDQHEIGPIRHGPQHRSSQYTGAWSGPVDLDVAAGRRSRSTIVP